MAGAPGAHGAKGKDNKGQNGERPDYLVEDEETWTPERNIAPKVIE
ncbi:collagen alpha 1(II) chain precursor [Streptomyces noursei]|nr:collagen alpha 1(II) chain precursor [Streptomyces noursei]